MFPYGITSYVIGGLITGSAVSFVYILTGTLVTQSSLRAHGNLPILVSNAGMLVGSYVLGRWFS